MPDLPPPMPKSALKQISIKGGSPGLVVMWDDLCSSHCGFDSQRQKLNGHFSHLFVVKIVLFAWKWLKINEKEAGVEPFFWKKNKLIFTLTYDHFDRNCLRPFFLLFCQKSFPSRGIEPGLLPFEICKGWLGSYVLVTCLPENFPF